MGFFSWAAPFFARFSDRWSDDTIVDYARHLRPYLHERRAVLDLGGGTGSLAARLADALDAEVTVLDITPEMLAHVPDRPRVHPVLGDAHAMPFEDGAFDAVVISDAFHHFPDQDRVVRELRRVLRPCGGVFILEFTPVWWFRPVVWLESLVGEPATFFRPAELRDYLRVRGIDGEITDVGRLNYGVLGTVAPPAGEPPCEETGPLPSPPLGQ